MGADILIGLGVAVAQLAIRLAGNEMIADGLGDLTTAGSEFRKLQRSRSQAKPMGRAIARQLEQHVGHLPADDDHVREFGAVARDVEALITEMMVEDVSILEAAKSPRGVREYVLHRGGQRIIRQAPMFAEAFAQRLVDAVADQLAQYAPTSATFSRAALTSLLRTADATLEAVVQLRDHVQELASARAAAGTTYSKADVAEHVRRQLILIRDLLGRSKGLVVQRADLVDFALRPRVYPVAFVGDGGVGKSVLIGEILEGVHDRDVVFVSCAALDGTDLLDDIDQIEDTLGRLVSGLTVSLSETLVAFGSRPLLVVDTLDILLREESASAISQLLSRWSERADLVLTCRSREWYDLLSSRQSNFTVHDMPSLTREEVITWSDRYMVHDRVPLEAAELFRDSLILALLEPRSLDVLGVPLRLAMATRLYAPAGAIPPDLTATQLYKYYWDERVGTGRDGRRNTRAVRAVEDTALEIAAEVWAQSVERFAEDLHYPRNPDAVNALISEGVLGLIGRRLHFFHQTFAEFAVARYLAAAAEPADFERLHDGLKSQRSGYWGIASHLMLEDLGTHRFERVVEHIPLDSVEGVRIVLDGLLARAEQKLTSAHLGRLVVLSPDFLAAASDIMASAPRAHLEAVAASLLRLAEVDAGDLTAVVRAIATLIRRLPTQQAGDLFESILNTLEARARRGDVLVASEARRLIDAVFPADTEISDSLLRIAVAHYSHQPAPGRLATIAVAQRQGNPELQSLLISNALCSDVPQGSVETLTGLVVGELSDPVRRAGRGWQTWTDILAVRLPRRWDSVQVRAIAQLGLDSAVRDSLVAEAITPTVGAPRDILINALRYVADAAPRQFAITLAAQPVPRAQSTANAYAQLVLQLEPSLGDSERAALVERLRTLSALAPRRVWAAILKLSASNPNALDAALGDLTDTVRSAETSPSLRATVQAACDALYQVVTPEVLSAQMDKLRSLWDLVGGSDDVQPAKALGLLAAVSRTARLQLDELVDSDRRRAQLAAIQALMAAKQRWPEQAWSQALPWLVNLIRTPNHGAVVVLAETLSSDVGDDNWSTVETEVVVDRLVLALRRRDDPQVSGTLVTLLAQAVHDGTPSSAPSPEQVGLMVTAYSLALESATIVADPQRAAAIYPQYVAVVANIAMTVLGTSRTTTLVEHLLSSTDITPFGSRARKHLSRAVVSVLRATPSWWSRAEGLWPEVPSANRGAIADAALSGLVPERKSVAERLARRSDCPPDVAADLLRRLRP